MKTYQNVKNCNFRWEVIYTSLSGLVSELQRPTISLTMYWMSLRYIKYNLVKTKLILSSLYHNPVKSVSP